jgi:hypothetical protein
MKAMISEAADKLLTADVRNPWARGISVRSTADRRFGVWLSETPRHDGPDGIGDSVSEALENAAYKLEMAAIIRLEMAARKGKA